MPGQDKHKELIEYTAKSQNFDWTVLWIKLFEKYWTSNENARDTTLLIGGNELSRNLFLFSQKKAFRCLIFEE
jgi:hypothetical protein